MNSPQALRQEEPRSSLRGSAAPDSPYTDANDRSRHLHNLERLAAETGMPVQELTPLYEEVLAGLNSRARIHDYIPILVSKNIKDLLRRH